MPEMLDHALQYAARGWPVFKIQPGTKKPYAGSHGFQDAATNEILITRMWDEDPDADIGMATGKVACVWVLDIDGEKGSSGLTALEAEYGPVPETLEARTGSGGRHLFYRWPAAREVRNKQKLLGHDGVDIRGEGGYVVLSPSQHPSGGTYSWPYGTETAIADIPAVWLDVIAPAKKRTAPWERSADAPIQRAPSTPGSTPILDRAKRYLAECEPATQGSGGHDSLLWAARAMVIGFGLDDATAISLLWSEYNPRCSPPWEMSNSSERRDFERKVSQARQTPGEKPAGWLLDEYGLRSGDDAMASIVGNRIANALLSKYASGSRAPDSEDEPMPERWEFPVNYFPERLASYCRSSAEANTVDASFVGLPMLAAAGAAMGNAWRLRLKGDFEVPPLLWVGLVAPSGANKSAPLHQVIAPLKNTPPATQDSLLNPQGRMVMSNATTEAVIARLNEAHRGIIIYRDELAGWASSFDAYKSGGGDEQTWIELWGGGSYYMDRKTNNEQVQIPAAAVSIVGGIQPSILAECFDPGKFASGLVPRILVTCPPDREHYWTDVEVDGNAKTAWHEDIQWLRTRPFIGLDPNKGQYMPRVLTLSPEAKEVFVRFYDQFEGVALRATNEHVVSFARKAQVQAARMILIHRGLVLAEAKSEHLDAPIGVESAIAGTAWMNWCLTEQMRIYGFAEGEKARSDAQELADRIRTKFSNKEVTIRDIQQTNTKKWKNSDQVRDAVQQMINHGLARWTEPKKKVVLI